MLSITAVFLLIHFTTLTSAFPATASSQPATASAKPKPSACPLYLPSSNYEFPHLIVPISHNNPNTSLGNTFTPSISPNDLATIFNFDILASRVTQTCTLYFSFPTHAQLDTTDYVFWSSGTASFQFVRYKAGSGAGGVDAKTTWRTQPEVDGLLGPVTIEGIAPGNVYKVWTGQCGKESVVSWRMSSKDSCLWWFQDFNECALGMYIVYG